MNMTTASRPTPEHQTGILLCTHTQAATLLSELAHNGSHFKLQVRQDKCFDSDQWLNLGDIHLYAPLTLGDPYSESTPYDAIVGGQYLWMTPPEEQLENDLTAAITGLNTKKADAVKTVKQGLQDALRRLNLLHPCFTVDSIQSWPYQRPSTWVLDVTAIMQGAADFAAQFLFPMVRLRVPSVTGVEIQDMCDGFLARFRKPLTSEGQKIELLRFHMKSQGAQRSLLRLEWKSNVEIERATIGSDPLRFVFQNDGKSEFPGLSLTTIQRSLADRLIFETAKEHRGRLSPGQPIHIVTSDQGMARMALSEGMSPIYFHARRGSEPLGRTLCGTVYHPFQPEFYSVSLVELLWEMATCFGSARLQLIDGTGEFEAIAISPALEWSPEHIKSNLFHCKWRLPESTPEETEVIVISETSNSDISATTDTESLPATNPHSGHGNEFGSVYIISVEKLFHLAHLLCQKESVNEKELESQLKTKASSLREYRIFLTSGGFLTYAHAVWQATEQLREMDTAFHNGNIESLREHLVRVPSFHTFLDYVASDGRRPDWREKYPVRGRAIPGYRDLSEICGLTLAIPNEGICLTPRNPTPQEFTDIAMQRYTELAKFDPLVETGQWLEALAWKDGIHPVVTRKCLEAAFRAGLLNRIFEGSTPDTKFDDHMLRVLEVEEGQPVIKKYYIYRGNFLWSERASVRLSLERVSS